MPVRIRMVGLALALGIASGSAQAVDVTECANMLEDDAARLACYDRVVTAEIRRLVEEKKAAQAAATPAPVQPPTQPASAVTPAKPAEDPWAGKPWVPGVASPVLKPAPKVYKRIDPSDVRATPAKWADRDIEFASANVYWVGDDDLRVLTSINMTLFGRKAAGDPADLVYLRENCETAKEAQSSKCRVRVRFAYTDHSEDTPNGFAKRTVLVSPVVELIRLQSGSRRR